MKKINWHEMAVCGLKITLKKYSHLLEFLSEYPLGKNNYRIDLLIIHKLSDILIPKQIAAIFRSYNLFEIKGVGSSLDIFAYYKTNGYAGLFVDSIKQKNGNFTSRFDITISFLCNRYPRKLFRHLSQNCGKPIEKYAPGIYYIHNEMYPTQVIVTSQLSDEENLYLQCITNHLTNPKQIENITTDYIENQENQIYETYMNYLTTANTDKKGESPMCCEGIFKLYGTSSKEIAEKAAKEATEQVEQKFISKIKELEEKNKILLAQIAQLQGNTNV